MQQGCGCGGAGNTNTNIVATAAGVIVTAIGNAVDTVGKIGQGLSEGAFGYSGSEWVIKNTIGGTYNEYRLLRPTWPKVSMGNFGNIVNAVADFAGAGLAVIPNQIADFNAGAPWNTNVADFLIDLGIWAGASAISAAALVAFAPAVGVGLAVVGAIAVGVVVTYVAYQAVDALNGRQVLSDLTYAAGANLSYASSQVAAIDPGYIPPLAGP
jgi:hypothetical protein